MLITDALLILSGTLFFASALGSGAAIAAITFVAVRRIRQMQLEITQLKNDLKAEIGAAEQRCTDRMRFSENALSEYADILRQYAEASGRNDIASILAARAGVMINAGQDVNVGGSVTGRDENTSAFAK